MLWMDGQKEKILHWTGGEDAGVAVADSDSFSDQAV